MLWRRHALAIPLLLPLGLIAQTTEGLISGRIADSQTGQAIGAATVTCWNSATNTTAGARTDIGGRYALPLLPPGQYRIRASAESYQSQEVQELTLAVAGTLEIDLRLRPLNDVWESGEYRSVYLPSSKAVVNFFGPDVDTSRSAFVAAPASAAGSFESTVSEVIDPAAIRDLPLAGRDVYTMLVTQPGVTADTTTARGLGISVNGQRPSASNFLMDGVENNNYLVTGPLTTVAPEAVQEYRISTNNFSAEYGRTAGFVANAVTRSGGARWHGIGYLDFKNTALDANGFQENLAGLGRQPVHEDEFGYQAGGPVRYGIFVSSSLDRLRSRDVSDPQPYYLPTPLVAVLAAPSSPAARLFAQFPTPVTGSSDYAARVLEAQPVSIDRSLALERADYVPGGRHRLMGRVAIARLGRPDFIWSPYPGFNSPLDQNTYSAVLAFTSELTPRVTNEARAAWDSDTLGWNRAHPEIPTIAMNSNGVAVTMPGSPAAYSYRNRTRAWEALDNVVWVRGAHILKMGGGGLWRSVGGYLALGEGGYDGFATPLFFAAGQPTSFYAGVPRIGPAGVPDYNRSYRYGQYDFFAQDTFRATSRLTLNYGVRYDNFGAPVNTGAAKDAVVQLGLGADFAQKLQTATLAMPGAGDQQLFQPDNSDWSGRFGIAYRVGGKGDTVVRGAYGIFYDRPFDNLWQTESANSIALTNLNLGGAYAVDFLQPVAATLAAFRSSALPSTFPNLTLFQNNLRNGYAQSWFAGVEQRWGESWTLEVNTLGALGRRLITTDQVNRPGTPGYNAALGTIEYRAGEGLSDYNALTALARYHTRRAQFQIAYTWSHSIDNQSDPLLGEFFADLSYVAPTASGARSNDATFARAFDSRADRGNSDFDQRQNLVFYSIWTLPARFQFAQMAAFRTGFPYSVAALSSFSIYNNRADLVSPNYAASGNVVGGKLLLNPAAFAQPADGTLGNTARNAFAGPGLLNIDVSLSRSFALPWLGEGGRLTLRADAFNFLNHANLNNPAALIGQPDFGVAQYGRTDFNAGFPSLTPLNETARQIQMILRVEF
jgi:hypothetical protein